MTMWHFYKKVTFGGNMEYFVFSELGNRDINEDYVDFVKVEDKMFFILADGLGGHGHGEIASREATNAVKEYLLSHKDEDVEKLVADCFQVAHQKLLNLQKEIGDKSFFKTTLVLLCIANNYFVWGNIGDSRIYHFEDNKIIERSMDHSIPQMLVNMGKLKENKIRHHEDRSRLTRVVGSDESTIKPFVTYKEPFTENSIFLICTDGFWEYINEKYMEKYLKNSKSPEEWVLKMEKLILKNGKRKKMDNYSAIAIFL